MSSLFQIKSEITSINPDVIFQIGDFPITNSYLLSTAILLLFVIVAVILRKSKVNPGGFQNFMEWIFEGMRTMVKQIMGGSERRTRGLFPLIATLFTYIAVSNLITTFPGITAITFGEASLFRGPTTDYNTTFAMAAGMIILIQLISIKEWGLFGYIGNYIKIKGIFQGFKKSIGDGFMAIIEFFIGLLDIISEIAKVISLSFRLFGNVFAGEVLVVLLMGAFAYFVPAIWLSLGLLFGLVQAIVFGSLVAAYYMLAVKPEVEEKTADA